MLYALKSEVLRKNTSTIQTQEDFWVTASLGADIHHHCKQSDTDKSLSSSQATQAQ